MNIYQNGDFSKNLHKLTKYQSLAATVNDMSKQSLYSKKIQEYKSKLDKVGTMQTGGGPYDSVRRDISNKIKSLVPEEYKQAFIQLRDAHAAIKLQLSQIASLVNSLIRRRGEVTEKTNKVTIDGLDQLIAALNDKTDPGAKSATADLQRLHSELLRLQGELSGAEAASRERLNTQAAELQKQIAAQQAASMQYLTEQQRNQFTLQIQSQLQLLQRENASLTSQLAALSGQISSTGKTGVGECDEQIRSILETIDRELGDKLNDSEKPNDQTTLIQSLSQTAQQVLQRLSTL